MSRTVINTDAAPAPVGAYNQAILHNGVLYVSGQIALDPATGELLTADIETETRRVLDNLGAILEAAGTNFANILKCSVFVSDIENFGRINTVYATYFDAETAPARALVEVANLPKYVNVEISCIAAVEG
ncbi:MAG: Rid family detoxifying hydrolase [Bacteroidota bacterium]